MAKRKLIRFDEMKTFQNLFQPSVQELFEGNHHPLRGKWGAEYFNNLNPVILEVGCGKGDYTIGLARKFPQKNFIGIDVKGARLWRGCKTAIEENLENVAFIRNKVEFLGSLFAENELSEIWVTFPDPQPNKMRKRLTSARFLDIYKQVLSPEAIVHLKTDSRELFDFTDQMIRLNNLDIHFQTFDLYRSDCDSEAVQIQTFYEKMFLEQSKPITYTKFSLKNCGKFTNPDADSE